MDKYAWWCTLLQYRNKMGLSGDICLPNAESLYLLQVIVWYPGNKVWNKSNRSKNRVDFKYQLELGKVQTRIAFSVYLFVVIMEWSFTEYVFWYT